LLDEIAHRRCMLSALCGRPGRQQSAARLVDSALRQEVADLDEHQARSAVRITTDTPVPANSPEYVAEYVWSHPGSKHLPRALAGRMATNLPPAFTSPAAASMCAIQRPSLKGGFITILS
jgi:hypothetical protein